MERRLIGVATGEIKRLLVGEGRVTSAGRRRRETTAAAAEIEGSTAFIRETEPDTRTSPDLMEREASTRLVFFFSFPPFPEMQ